MNAIALNRFTPLRGLASRLARAIALLLVTAILLCHCSGLQAALFRAPPVAVSVEPEENGRLVFLPIVPGTAHEDGRQFLGLRLRMTNNSNNELRLTTIRLTFTYPTALITAVQFHRDLAIAPGGTKTDYLSNEESVQLPEIPPSLVRIELFFEGFSEPKSLDRELAPYVVSAPGGRYLFPANEKDLGPDQYFSHVARHTGGSQTFGYDFHVREWNGQDFSALKAGGNPDANEDYSGWNVPIYSLAEGVVLAVSKGWENNAGPGMKAVQRMGDALAGSITDVQVAGLSSTRAATLARLPSGALQLSVWDLGEEGRDIVRLGSASGESIGELALVALSQSRLVTALQTASGALRIVVWEISEDGQTISRLGERDEAGIQALSLVKLSSQRFATAVRTEEGTLRLVLWEISSDGNSIYLSDHQFAGTASSISVVNLTSTRLVTSLRTALGNLKLIVWDIGNDHTLVRQGELTVDAISRARAVAVSKSQVAVAMQTAAGNLKLVQWNVSANGLVLTRELEEEAGQIQGLARPLLVHSYILTPVITEAGHYKHILWRNPKEEDGDDPSRFYRAADAEAGVVDRLSADTPADGFIVSAVRTAAGNLKLITWIRVSGGGNSVVILHGNCRVLYAHFKAGSVNPDLAPGTRIAAGELVGRMGNSGSSGGVHTHIHAERVSDALSVEEILELEANDAVPLVGYRPVPFHCARAMRLNDLQPGGLDNPFNAFSALHGHGVYFEAYAVRPTWLYKIHVDGTSTCPAPEGRKECLGTEPFHYGGPFHTVTDAVQAECKGSKLLIRGGHYPESIIINRAMTLQAYEATALIGQ